eukprot:scaffold86358_cov47-Cyclotella_meneghiniana.AAC.4
MVFDEVANVSSCQFCSSLPNDFLIVGEKTSVLTGTLKMSLALCSTQWAYASAVTWSTVKTTMRARFGSCHLSVVATNSIPVILSKDGKS